MSTRLMLVLLVVLVTSIAFAQGEDDSSALVVKWTALQADLMVVHKLYLTQPRDEAKLRADASRLVSTWGSVSAQMPAKIVSEYDVNGIFGCLLAAAMDCLHSLSQGLTPNGAALCEKQEHFVHCWSESGRSAKLSLPACSHWFTGEAAPTAGSAPEIQMGLTNWSNGVPIIRSADSPQEVVGDVLGGLRAVQSEWQIQRDAGKPVTYFHFYHQLNALYRTIDALSEEVPKSLSGCAQDACLSAYYVMRKAEQTGIVEPEEMNMMILRFQSMAQSWGVAVE